MTTTIAPVTDPTTDDAVPGGPPPGSGATAGPGKLAPPPVGGPLAGDIEPIASSQLTAKGIKGENAGDLAEVWAPFEARTGGGERSEERTDYGSLKPEIGQVMSAVWQIISSGSERQRREAVEVLVETRRKLYGILAEGDAE